jgi:hypothetical protein
MLLGPSGTTTSMHVPLPRTETLPALAAHKRDQLLRWALAVWTAPLVPTTST